MRLHKQEIENFAVEDIEFLEEQIEKREILQQQGAKVAKSILKEVKKDEDELKQIIAKEFSAEN